MRSWICAALGALSLGACATAPASNETSVAAEEHWIPLFNGRDFEGWTIKIAKHPLGENYNNTFRVEDGLIKVRYDQYDVLNDQHGHLFWHTPYSHYRLRVEYRFVGEQVAGAPEWAYRNNGIIFHAQPAATMGLDQPFPTGLEFQFLGGDGSGSRPTGNLCTPGTSVLLNGARPSEHCLENFNGPTLDGEQWVTAEVEVRGGTLIRHLINGIEVLRYSDPTLDEVQSWSPSQALTSGYFAIQAESHPTDFRKIELLVLEP